MPKAAGEILDEVIAIAHNEIAKTKQQTFWAKVVTKTEEITAAIEDARQDGYTLGFGEGRDEGYDHGYRDGKTDREET